MGQRKGDVAMTQTEKVLLFVLGKLNDLNLRAMVAERFIQENGPLSEEAGELVRKQLRPKRRDR